MIRQILFLASYYFWRRLLIQGFWCFGVVREPWILGKSCEIDKTMQNTKNYARNFAKYMLPQHIWNLQYIWTYPGCWGCLFSTKLHNYLNKYPKSSRCSWINVTKKWAMVTMLKALPLVHFSNALLLRERIKISVEIKQMANRLIYFFLASPNKLFNLLSFLRKTRSKCTIFPFCGRFLVSLCWLLHTVACKLCKL